MIVRQLAQSQSIRCKDTTKLFWGIYPYSLATTIPSKLIDTRQKKMAKFWNVSKTTSNSRLSPEKINQAYEQGLQDHIDLFIDKNSSALDAEDEFYYQIGDANIIFYFKTARIVELILRNNEGYFSTLTSPKDEQIATHLTGIDGNTLIRKKLFHNQFKFRVTFTRDPLFEGGPYQNIDRRIENLIFGNCLYLKGASRILYLDSEEDLFLLKMGISDKIDKITKCVLIDDLPNKD